MRIRFASSLAAAAGLGLGTAIIAYFGVGSVLGSLARIGWDGLAAVIVYHLATYMLLGLCWWTIEPQPRHALPIYVWGRLVRDSAGEVLPFSQLGGFVMGARATVLAGLPAPLAAASTVVDVTLELFAKLAYTVLGLELFAQVRPHSTVLLPGLIGVLAAAAAVAGFVAVQHRGASGIERFIQRLAARFLGQEAIAGTPTSACIAELYANRAALLSGASLHFVSWVVGGMEAWVALHLMGIAMRLEAVLAMESLLYAIRSAAFAVPNAIGVQEGAYVMLGSFLGLPPQSALALSLLKRGRDILIGAPVLLTWQALEARSSRQRRARESAQ